MAQTTNSRTRATRLLAVTIAGATLLAACGGGSTSTETTRTRNAALTQASPLNFRVSAIGAGINTAVVLLDNGRVKFLGEDAYSPSAIEEAVAGQRIVLVRTDYSKVGTLDDQGRLTVRGWEWQRQIPQLPSGATKWTDFDTHESGTIAIADNGALAQANVINALSLPTLANGGTKFVKVERGVQHGVFLDDKGNAYVSGGDEPVPTLANGGTKFVDVSADFYSTGYVDDAGNAYVRGWILNYATPPALRNGGTKFVDIQIGYTTYALLDDKGNVYFASDSQVAPPALPPGATKFVSVALGNGYSFALADTGEIVTTKFHDRAAPPVLSQRRPALPIAASGNATLVVDDQGKIRQFGTGFSVSPPDPGPVSSVGAGLSHGLAVTAAGRIVGWGQSGHDQTTAPDRSDFVKVVGGATFSAAITDTGRVVSWGIAPPTPTTASRDASVSSLTAVQSRAVDISAGIDHYTVLTSNGGAFSIGANSAQAPRNSFGPMPFMRNVRLGAIASYGGCSAAVDIANGTTNQNVTTWGTCSAAIVAPRLQGVVSIAMGANHMIALTSEGRIIAWGDNSYGQTTVPTGLTQAIYIAAGANHTVAVDASGRVWAWGDNTFGQSAMPEDLKLSSGELAAITEARTARNREIAAAAALPAGTSGDSLVPPNAPAGAAEALQKIADAAPVVTLPKSQDTGLTVKKGRTFTPAQAVKVLRIKGAKKPAFVATKSTKADACRVTATRVSATKAGTCTAIINYVDAKGKKASATFVVVVTS